MKLPRILHLHHDPTWRVVGANRYEQCRCGARRTSRAYRDLAGPTADDWPTCRDRHGRPALTSGWQRDDWATTGYPETRTASR